MPPFVTLRSVSYSTDLSMSGNKNAPAHIGDKQKSEIGKNEVGYPWEKGDCTPRKKRRKPSFHIPEVGKVCQPTQIGSKMANRTPGRKEIYSIPIPETGRMSDIREKSRVVKKSPKGGPFKHERGSCRGGSMSPP